MSFDPAGLDATWGGLVANTYVDLVTANSIATRMLYTDAWDLAAATPAKQASALVMAAEQIDGRNWRGNRYFPNQALAFPRLVEGYALPTGYWNQVAPDANFEMLVSSDNFLRLQKERVQRAAVYQAMYVLKTEGEQAHRESQLQGLSGLARGRRFSESFSYREPSFVLCPEAMDQLRWYRGTIKIVRGGSHQSPYDER